MEAFEWTRFAAELQGSGFALFQRELTKFNRYRLEPSLPHRAWRNHINDECRVLQAEGEFVEADRREIAPVTRDIPESVDAFVACPMAGSHSPLGSDEVVY